MLAQAPSLSFLVKQREFFSSHQTKSLDFRLEQLKKLRNAVLQFQAEIIFALAEDLKKSEFEARFEIIGVIQEIDFVLKHLKQWMKPKPVALSLINLPGKAYQLPEPLGSVLIMGPWNFPFSLVFQPLVGAIAAGNCSVLKPSEMAPAVSQVTAKLIAATFEEPYITVQEGGVDIAQTLLTQPFDHIFFTGGEKVGKLVMAAAAQHLTPVTLELGGKSPCLVDRHTDLQKTAQRIVWGKFINAGQICIAPDYLLVQEQMKEDLLAALRQCIEDFYGPQPQQNPDYPRLIHQGHCQRIIDLMAYGDIFYGGDHDLDDRYVAPTILTNPQIDSPLMQEEIFGPLLPVIPYTTLEEAIAFIQARPKPLALYIFSKDKQVQNQIIQGTSSGGICINDTILQVGVENLPFGGVGPSGMGAYHGKSSFDTFSHYKSVLKKGFTVSGSWRFPPYKDKLSLLKSMFKTK
jgi:acyl-CoA reductase-like NAD-dependent aldehyde dehydrogenase